MRITAIVVNTFREAIRDKVFIAIIILSILVMTSGYVIKPLALGEEAKIIKDIGLNSITLFSVLITILIGTRLVYKEIEKRTIYIILSRSLHRWEFIIGKYLGLLLVLFESILIMLGVFYLILLLLGIQANFLLLLSVLMTFCQLWILTALAIFFSTFTTPITSAVFTFMVYFIGHFTRDLKVLAALSKSPQLKVIADIIYVLIPNLSNFNVKAEVVHNVIIDPKIIIFTIIYALIYSFIVIFISCIIFQRKDF